MAAAARYFVTDIRGTFIDWGVYFQGFSLAGKEIQVTGGAGNDVVAVQAGASADLTNLGGGANRILLSGGLLYLCARWLPRLRAWLTTRPCCMHEATHVYMENGYGQRELVPVSRDHFGPQLCALFRACDEAAADSDSDTESTCSSSGKIR